jgi:hypothetical protein
MAIKGLEYEATELFFDGVRTIDENNCVSLRSIALSLNRIADSMDMGDTDEHMCIPKSLGAIAHALAGDKI